MKKLPPFGKGLNALIESGQRPSNSILVYTGNHAWEKGHGFSISYPERLLILPPWLSPETYYWPVTGCDVLITDTGFAEDDYIEDLVLCLFSYGATVCRFISHDYIFTKFTKE